MFSIPSAQGIAQAGLFPNMLQKTPQCCSEASKPGWRGRPVASHPQHPPAKDAPGCGMWPNGRHVPGDEGSSEGGGVSQPWGTRGFGSAGSSAEGLGPGRSWPPHHGAGHPWHPGAPWSPRRCCGSARVGDGSRGWGRAAGPRFGEISGLFGASGCWGRGGVTVGLEGNESPGWSPQSWQRW